VRVIFLVPGTGSAIRRLSEQKFEVLLSDIKMKIHDRDDE
jgi:hypothetical protein